eukprot:4565107-Pyramimonas_sp.AAC.1
MDGHIFLDGSWHDQDLPAHAQAAGWAVVAVEAVTAKVRSVLVGVLPGTIVDIDAAELTAFPQGTPACHPWGDFLHRSEFRFRGSLFPRSQALLQQQQRLG